MKVAHEYAATFPARLALARWARGGDIPHIDIPADRLPARAAWYAQAQDDFQSWLEAGGFHRSESDGFDSAGCDCPAPTGGADRRAPLVFEIDAGAGAQAIVIGRRASENDAFAPPCLGAWTLDADDCGGRGDAAAK